VSRRGPQYIVTKLTMSGGHRHIFSTHRTLREARAKVQKFRLADFGFSPRIYRRVE
jgi:hypothetical protein